MTKTRVQMDRKTLMSINQRLSGAYRLMEQKDGSLHLTWNGDHASVHDPRPAGVGMPTDLFTRRQAMLQRALSGVQGHQISVSDLP